MQDDVAFEIVVQILHVVGYEFTNDHILLRLTLDGHRLQTGNIYAKTDKVAVDTHVSWTMTKGDVKRMKNENLPIKVECFRVRDRGHLEDIGFVLVPLRTIPTCLYKNDELLPSPRWYKIMGVPNDLLHNKPELHLNVLIQPEQECLSAGHLRGKFDDDGDEAFIEPDIANHFELKFTDEDEEKSDKDIQQQEIATPKIQPVVAVAAEAPMAQEKIIEPVKVSAQETSNDRLDADRYKKNLEEWKNEEKDNFMAHLKKVENQFLESMFEEWQRKKHEEENKLQWTIEECDRLSKKLEEGYANMKELQRTEKESQSLSNTQSVLQEELALERQRTAALEMELREEREENKLLRHRIRDMELTTAANENEIAEQIKQLEAAMLKLKQSKDYYKQKWLQLIREVNKLSPNDS